ncbi:MAG: transcriptional repressor [Deltaproteobacteria bacterium]|nr:transcriptional repressor [Deltaproteobacteria bacterium]
MSPQNFLDSGQKYRMTHQRQVILEEVQKVNTHPTADEVYEMVRKRLPRISLGTVYRNLEFLSTSGLIQKIGPPSNQMRFDGKTENHYHIRCVSCGKVEDAPVESLDNVERAMRSHSDYSILGHRLEFLGICPACRGKETSFHKNV